MAGHLNNPPLVEALLEIRWDLQNAGTPDTFRDPAYKFAVGRLYDRVHKQFPFVQELPVAQFPDEISAYLVKQQFRKERGGWPLVQLGPGVFTLNFATGYKWKEFYQTAKDVLPKLLEAYQGPLPDAVPAELKINSVVLRYINAVSMAWETTNALEFLGAKLHAKFALPDKITQSNVIVGMPSVVNLQVGYPLTDPMGLGIMRFATGQRGQESSLIWELQVQTRGKDAPQLSDMDAFMGWLTKAHDDVIEAWFLSLIEGDLQNQFQ